MSLPDTWPTLDPSESNIAPDSFGPTPSQTVGPYFHQGLILESGLMNAQDHILVAPRSEARGERIWLRGRVLDGDGEPVPDALVEIWQADASGQYFHPTDLQSQQADPPFFGFGRSDTRHPGGEFLFRTIKPGEIARSGQAALAPHLDVWLGMRGLLTHLFTRVYFSDEDNTGDPVLAGVPEARRRTLIAIREDTPEGPVYRLDFHMQGPHETVFFDV